MPDLNHSITTHRLTLREWCRNPRHIAARNEQLKKHPFCSRCGRPASLILHEAPQDYEHGFEHYVGLIERGERPTGCPACNKAEQKNMRPCPVCVAKHKEDPAVKIHYIPADSAEGHCRYCDPQYNPERIRYKRELKNRTKRALSRDRYNRTHPHVKIVNIKTGLWEKVARV